MARRFVDPRFTVAAVARRIGMPLARWSGHCYDVAQACLEAGLVQGYLCYGLYHGPIAPTSPFAGRALTHHGWIELADRTVWDPTRWVFEDVRPYIYCGPDRDYDFGANRLAAALLKPAPHARADEARIALGLPAATTLYLGMLLKNPGWEGAGTPAQLFWLANLPLQLLDEHARTLYEALTRVGHRAFIPIDNHTRVLAAPVPPTAAPAAPRRPRRRRLAGGVSTRSR